VILPNSVTFNTYGWQPANTTGNAVTLNEGDNIVQFISGRDDVPMVREVKIFNQRNRNTNYLYEMARGRVPSINQPTILPYYGSRPMYRYGMAIDTPYYYTFILPIEYTRGSIATFYVPSNTATVDFNMYLFHENPNLYSKSMSCNDNRYLYFEDPIHITGTYYLLLEAKDLGARGGVTIVVNNTTTYRNSFVSNTSFPVVKKDPLGIVPYANLPYNIFTTNLKAADEYHDADSYLYLKKFVKNQNNQLKEIVIAYSDSNQVRSDFNWGKNARIRRELSDDTLYAVGLCSMYPFLYSTPDTCDIYYSFWNTLDTTLYMSDNGRNYFSKEFPNLRYEDAIESDKGGGYNCYPWAAGLTFTDIWIYSNDVPDILDELEWFNSLFMNDTVHSYSGYIARPPGSIRYVPCPPGAEDAVVDLWGDVDNEGIPIGISHASIRNTENTPRHGYDWESKDGMALRFFHPRTSIGGNKYDAIIASYRIHDDDLQKKDSLPETIIYKALAEGSFVIENIKLTEDDKNALKQKNQLQSTYTIDRFESLYNQWIEYVRPYQKYYNFALFKDSVYYPQIRDYILSNLDVEYKIYNKFVEGDIPAIVLMKDLASIENSRANKVWSKTVDAPLEEGIMRTTWSNINLFIKTMLQEQEGEALPQTGRIRSNEDNINVITENEGIAISIEFENVSIFSIKAINLQTSRQLILCPESMHQAGEEIYQYSLNPGVYVIAVEIDGNINAKKVIVK
ncbi:MAG: hypothetical protein IKW05_04040, partial [Muribaculaceae bacterium]|nr:hypothetical protein [Muribaculaceae bacterium]